MYVFQNYNTFLLSTWANDINVQAALHIRKVQNFSSTNSIRYISMQILYLNSANDHQGTLISKWKRCNHDLLYDKDVRSVVQVHLELNKRGYRALIYRLIPHNMNHHFCTCMVCNN